ncbi:MAG: discoidin domain-containing protein, partial [Armatimonadota bacterium]|nr:discoidin domain-containing protein [Armatimonadota bacterium]
ADLETLRANLDREPWKSGYAALAAEGRSQLTYKMAGPFANVSRAPHVNLNQWRSDMVAIWNLSRMWYFTGNTAYAQKAHDILLAWATTHTSFTGRECMLDLGDYAYMFVGGADILRGTWPGWTEADTTAVKAYFGNVLLPATNPYGESQFGAANKGALALVAGGLLAIFNDDTARLDKIVYQVRTLAHIGLRSSNDIGMLGDSLRDQGHAHGQLISLAMLAEALWKQGIDIYSDYDNRLLAAGEYFARVNERVPTPFLPFGTTDAYYLADNTNRGWGGGNVALNLIHGAYVIRKGLPAPYIAQRRQRLPVDGNSFMFIKETDTSVATPAAVLSFPMTTSMTAGFSNVEIGGATPNGTASYSGGIWTVRGGGTDIWGANDSSHFTYKAITGDCAIIAKVESVQNTSLNAKAGVMMRTSLSQGAPRAWMAITGGANLEQNMPQLAVYGGTNYGNKVLARSLPSYWVKLERIGNIITGYVSPDGTNWAATDVGRIDAPVPDTIYVGLVVCSAANGTLNSSTFSNVQITGGNGGAPVLTPAAPTALLASPGDKAVPLRWQPSFGATSYTVKRATSSGGAYSTVAAGITASSYTDKTVTNGTTYYYVVTATNSAGTSANSPQDSATPQMPMVNVALGGTATASASGSLKAEVPEKAFDRNVATRWFNGDAGPTGWIQYDFGAGVTQTIKRYSVASAFDVPGRDPKDWEFQGSNDGSTWTTLDTQNNQTFDQRFQMKTYTVASPAAYRYYRLNITANNGDPKGTHLAELALLVEKERAKPVGRKVP